MKKPPTFTRKDLLPLRALLESRAYTTTYLIFRSVKVGSAICLACGHKHRHVLRIRHAKNCEFVAHYKAVDHLKRLLSKEHL